jgi:SpoIID/LytB domain protein
VLAAAIATLAGFVYAPVASAATGDFVISGRGYGQGQGMSQWGMWQGAREGNTYKQILAFYYPGTTLTTVSAVAPASPRATVASYERENTV